MSDNFYNGNKLLSMRDINGEKPELFFCCGNRTAGKTFFFKRWMLRRFAEHGEKFVVFVRFIDDIANTVDGFFADIGPISFPGHEMSQAPLLHGKAATMYFDGKPCGYVIALNDPERIKRNSALFADAERGFMDEFMSETGKYVSDELLKFNSIRISIGRGGSKGKHVRYFPVYLCSNNVTIFNPYFEYFHIAKRLENRTKFLRGDKWVLEQTFNRQASEAIKKAYSGIDAKELRYAASNEYLLDNNKFVTKIPGQKYPLLTIVYNGERFGVWSSGDFIYVSQKESDGNVNVLSFNMEDHDEDNVLSQSASPLGKSLRKSYMNNMVRFSSQKCKHMFLDILAMIPK